MKFQIQYHWLGIEPGTFSAEEQWLRLQGYAAARRRHRMWLISWVIWAIWFIVWQKIESPVRIYLGLPLHGELWADFVATTMALGPLVIALLLVWGWPTSSAPEKFEKRFVTSVRRQRRKVSFGLKTPSMPETFLRVTFLANSVEEAEQIEKVLLNGQEMTSAVIIPPDGEQDILSDQLPKRDVTTHKSQPETDKAVIISPDVKRDILSGQLSKRDIMVKYAIRAEELEQMSKMLVGKSQRDLSERITIIPDIEKDILSGQLSEQDVITHKSQPETDKAVIISPDVKRDILSGQLSKRDIMVKYAIRAEELHAMYKALTLKD